ncbi:MAG: hypothetical protein J0H64_09835, partial [Actinobacteria bacterium]|nr:hypothetical protein [Actinomycetota bacterium]
REEMTLGNISVAAALPSVAGLPPIAVGLVVRLDRVSGAEAERRLGALVVQSAREIHATIRESGR